MTNHRGLSGRRGVVLLASAVMFSGCSTLDKTAVYIPDLSPGWVVVNRPKDFHKKSSSSYRKESYAEFACRGRKISVQEYEGGNSTWKGPIMIPFIPIGSYSYKNRFEIGYGYSDKDRLPLYGSGECPAIKFDDGVYAEGVKVSDQGWCSYAYKDEKKDFSISISDDEMKCNMRPLRMRYIKDWLYSPIINIPETFISFSWSTF